MNTICDAEESAFKRGVALERERIHRLVMDAIKHNWTVQGKMVTLADIALRLEKDRKGEK